MTWVQQNFQGPQGFQGNSNLFGIQGQQGYQGNQGIQGIQGVQGCAGASQGVQGAQGAQGLQMSGRVNDTAFWELRPVCERCGRGYYREVLSGDMPSNAESTDLECPCGASVNYYTIVWKKVYFIEVEC